jgi:acyl-CoA dehydrogenase
LHAPFFRSYLAALAEREWLMASATSEAGVGGDLRRSVCAVERDGTRIRVTKHALRELLNDFVSEPGCV